MNPCSVLAILSHAGLKENLLGHILSAFGTHALKLDFMPASLFDVNDGRPTECVRPVISAPLWLLLPSPADGRSSFDEPFSHGTLDVGLVRRVECLLHRHSFFIFLCPLDDCGFVAIVKQGCTLRDLFILLAPQSRDSDGVM